MRLERTIIITYTRPGDHSDKPKRKKSQAPDRASDRTSTRTCIRPCTCDRAIKQLIQGGDRSRVRDRDRGLNPTVNEEHILPQYCIFPAIKVPSNQLDGGDDVAGFNPA